MSHRGGRSGRGGRRGTQPTVEEAAKQRIMEATQVNLAKQHFEPIWIDPYFLAESTVQDEVTAMLTASGWPGLLSLSCEADKEDVSEFLAGFNYKGHSEEEDQGGIYYSHRERFRDCPMPLLRDVFGWAEGGEILAFDAETTVTQVWSTLSTLPYKGGETKARALREPALFYLHHILSKTIFAKKNADKVGLLEMSVLYMLREGRVIHWAHYFCKFLKNLKRTSPICCGGMITYFLRDVHPLPVPAEHHILHSSYADRIWFLNGQNIEITRQGTVQWVYFEDQSLLPAPEERRARARRPSGQTSRSRHTVERGESSQQAAPPQDLARMHVDYVFNTVRAGILGPHISIVPAPPGWAPGDLVPQEYLQPHPPAF